VNSSEGRATLHASSLNLDYPSQTKETLVAAADNIATPLGNRIF